jgi:hypothetical protein
MRKLTLAALTVAAVLAGCASKPQLPVSMGGNDEWKSSGPVGIVMTAVPAPNTYFPGAGCLLCIGFAELSNSSLTTHTKTLSRDEFESLKEDAAGALRKKGAEVVVFNDKVVLDTLPKGKGENGPAKDFASLKSKYPVNRLLVIQVDMVGYERTYANYIPTSDAKAYVKAQGFIIDMADNHYHWYQPVEVRRAAEGAWDEAPSFPGLTNAYYQAVEQAKDALLSPLRQP